MHPRRTAAVVEDEHVHVVVSSFQRIWTKARHSTPHLEAMNDTSKWHKAAVSLAISINIIGPGTYISA